MSTVRLTSQGERSMNGKLVTVFGTSGAIGGSLAGSGIPVYISGDGGAQWELLSRVALPTSMRRHGWRMTANPHISQVLRSSGHGLVAGTLLFEANAQRVNVRHKAIEEDLRLYMSRDGGRTWVFKSSIAHGRGHGGYVLDGENRSVWEPFVLSLPGGALVAYYSSQQYKHNGFNQAIVERVSHDGGEHWGNPRIVVAMPGGVERPGMPTVARLPNGEYVMSYEDVNGPNNGQVFLRYSRDATNWGRSSYRGIPVETDGGSWPAGTPVVHWFPGGGPNGVVVVTAHYTHSDRGWGPAPLGVGAVQALFWNRSLGQGPWWRMAPAIRRCSGNPLAGWTDALIPVGAHKLLQIGSSASKRRPQQLQDNVILYGTEDASWNSYAAADAKRVGGVVVPSADNPVGAVVMLPAIKGAKLEFNIFAARNRPRFMKLTFVGVTFPSVPVIYINGHLDKKTHVQSDPTRWKSLLSLVRLRRGSNLISVESGAHAIYVGELTMSRHHTKM